MGQNKSTGWKKTMDKLLIHCNFGLRLKFNKHTIPNKKVLLEKNSEINRHTLYVY